MDIISLKHLLFKICLDEYMKLSVVTYYVFIEKKFFLGIY